MQRPDLIGQHFYTWCERHEGCDGVSGFQTRAKSPAITPEIEKVIKNYCTRYGLPQSLRDLEMRASKLTDADLDRAPVAIHYFMINSELRGLTRLRLAAVQRGGGNFFAHTLIFPVRMLQPLSYNPFLALRSGVFQNDAGKAGKTLSDLTAFPKPSSVSLSTSPSGDDQSNQAVIQTISALTAPPGQQRPIILCAPQFRALAPLMENVLLCLPPEYRADLTFSTYDLDPYRLRQATGGEDQPGQRLIGTIPEKEGGKFQFREDEYQSRYYIFNLAEPRFSALPEDLMPRYRQMAQAAIKEGRWEELQLAQRLYSMLDLASSPETWDKALPATALLAAEDLSPEACEASFLVLTEVCRQPNQARQGLHLLIERTHKLLKTMSQKTFQAWAAAIAALISTSTRPKSPSPQEKPARVISLAKGLLLVLAACFLSIAVTWIYMDMRVIPEYRQQIAQLQGQGTGSERIAPAATSPITPPPPQPPATSSPPPPDRLAALEQAITAKGITKRLAGPTLYLSFDIGLFDRGDALNNNGRQVLSELSNQLVKFSQPMVIEVEGHTDNLPVGKNSAYKDNLALGFLRARTVAEFFLHTSNLPADRLRVSSVGEHQALFANDTPEQRQKNRTVVIKLVPPK